jgi:hypothetical protein
MAVPDRYRGPKPQIARGGGLSGAGLLIGGLLVVAFAVGVIVAGYFLMASPAKMSETVLSATGKIAPAAAPTPVDDGSWTDSDIKGCNDRATKAAEVARRRRLAAVSADRVGLGGPDAEMVQRATYLLCGATHKRLHLCQAYWRDWFVGAIKEHATDFKKVSTSSYWAKVSLQQKALSDAGNRQNWQNLSDDLDQTTREIGAMHDEITESFRGLIRDGIIDPADFGVVLGFGIPPEIAAMVGGTGAARHLCG